MSVDREALEISAAELASVLGGDDPPRLLDISTPQEQAVVALKHGLLLTQALFEEMTREWPKDAAIVAYCHHGIRSMEATLFLRNQGFENVRSLRGGIDAWAQEIDPAMPRY